MGVVGARAQICTFPVFTPGDAQVFSDWGGKGFPLAGCRDSLASVRLIGEERRWNFGGLATGAWKRGRAAAQAHGRARERVPAAVGGRASARDCPLRPFPGEPAGHGGRSDRGLGRADRGGVRGSSCSGDPGQQRFQLPHHGVAAWARSARASAGAWCCMRCWRWTRRPAAVWGWRRGASGPVRDGAASVTTRAKRTLKADIAFLLIRSKSDPKQM